MTNPHAKAKQGQGGHTNHTAVLTTGPDLYICEEVKCPVLTLYVL